MVVTYFKIGAKNFTQLMNRLDEQRKLNMKQVKDLVAKNKHDINNTKKKQINNENELLTQSVKKCEEYLTAKGGAKTGNKMNCKTHTCYFQT